MAVQKKLNVLISNDDGINSPGIYALVQQIRKIAHVTVVAPDKQQSAVGHAITVGYPLRASKFYKNGIFFGHAVEGTPADAVKLAVRSILREKPEMLISGINHGSNTAISIIYSGTVSAATEGTILGIPSVAVSLTTHERADFTYAAKFTRKLALHLSKKSLPEGTLLNVNVPPVPEEAIRGILVTRQGKSKWDDTFDVRRDPNNKEYFWLAGDLLQLDQDEDIDQVAILKNYISITPIHYDLTDYSMIETMKHWNLQKLT
ncbi:MAG: 5'/3'-nucleotidase SurE [Bacteroidota bacterium]